MAESYPVAGRQLQIRRGGRVLLDVPEITLGHVACSAVVGPNGAGKSLLVRTLCALTSPDQGTVTWADRAPDHARRRNVGLLLQRPVLLKRSALDNVIYPLRVAGLGLAQARRTAQASLSRAGLSAQASVFAPQLSGGEQQRLALARALALKPDMLFLDEATANVDTASTLSIEQQLQVAMAEGLRVVMVSHDMGQVKRLADEVTLMHNGSIIEHGTQHHFFNLTTHPVTRRWLSGDLLL